MVTYTFTNGTAADADEVNHNFTDVEKTAGKAGAQGAYQTLQANDVFENKDNLAADEFTDSDGTNNTVDTGNSTATFSTDHYECAGGAGSYADSTVQTTTVLIGEQAPNSIAVYIDASGLLKTGTGDSTNDTTTTGLEAEATPVTPSIHGVTFVMNENALLKTITTHASCTATRALLYDYKKQLIETASISSNSATFSGTVCLEAGKMYSIGVDNSGGSYTTVRDTNTTGTHTYTYPISGTYMDLISGYATSGYELTNMRNIATIVTESVASPTTLTDITLDVSDDGGGSFAITAQSRDGNSFLVDTSSLTGTFLALKFNLDTNDTDFTPNLKGFGVFVVN